MGKHENNVVMIEEFMLEHKLSAYNREEVTEKTGVSSGAVRSILRNMHKEGRLEKQMVKEHNGEKRVYYFWRRCEHMAGQRCVGDDRKKCPAGDLCCVYCERDCDMVCKVAVEYRPKEEKNA